MNKTGTNTPRVRITPHRVFLVWCGGSVGGFARHLLSIALPHNFLWLIVCNLTGAFLLGSLAAHVKTLPGNTHPRSLRARLARTTPFWGTGALGAFTTYSAMMLLPMSSLTVPLMVIAGIVAAGAGTWVGSRTGPSSTSGRTAS